MMELAPGFRGKNTMKKPLHGGRGGGIELDYDTLFVIDLPESMVLRIIGRSFLLAMFIIALPCIGPILNRPPSSLYVEDYYLYNFQSDSTNLEFLNMVLHDIVDEGLIKRGDKAPILVSDIEDIDYNFQYLKENQIEVVIMDYNEKLHSSILNESFDLAFISSFDNVQFIECFLKNGDKLNYEIVYVGRFRFKSVALAINKSGMTHESVCFSMKRGLCTHSRKAQKMAQKGLDYYSLHKGQQALARSNKYIIAKFDTSNGPLKIEKKGGRILRRNHRKIL